MEFQKAADGKELLGRRLKNWKLELDHETLATFMKQRQIKTINAFYAAIGEGTIDVGEIKDFLNCSQKESETQDENRQQRVFTQNEQGRDDILIIDAKNVKGLDYQMAKCCNPVFGDDVFGFVSIRGGIKIHRISCPNAARLIEKYPYRIQKVKWSESPSTGNFQTGLRITTINESSAINEIMDVVNGFRASIRSFSFTENQRNGTYEITTKIAVPSNLELDKIVSLIRQKKNVLKIARN